MSIQLPSLAEAVTAYFQAKSLSLADASDFQLRKVGSITCLHRHPNWPEVDGFYGLDVSPADTVAAVRAYGPDERHMITVFASAPEILIQEYRQLGYEPGLTPQPFMIKSLSGLTSVTVEYDVHARATPTRTHYWVEAESETVCRGSSVVTPSGAVYIFGMETLPTHRRCGLASAVLHRIHTDAAALGVCYSLLCSSPMGLPLYRSAGYTQLALMQSFLPIAC